MSLLKPFRDLTGRTSLPGFDWPTLEAAWEKNGFLHLPHLIGAEMVAKIKAELNRYIEPERQRLSTQATVDILHGKLRGQLLRLQDAPDQALDGPIKVNNLFVESKSMRLGTYDPAVLSILTHLLGEAPVAINSLNFLYGSQQSAHIDSWYMPPPERDQLVVAAIFLDQVDERNGPLFYYPGSHKIPAYRFSHGGRHAVLEEMADCHAYYREQRESAGIQRSTVDACPGDVVFWHCQLMHGGEPIQQFDKTRRSLVTHYWGESCLPRDRIGRFKKGQYYQKRAYHQLSSTAAEKMAKGKRPVITIVPTKGDPTMLKHRAFETWDIKNETLAQVEARIHDGAPADRLGDRAHSYLKTMQHLFPSIVPEPGCRAIEIGSGVGYIMEAFQQRYSPSHLIGLDVAPGMIEKAAERFERDQVNQSKLDLQLYDGITFPLANDSVDFAYSVAAMQHVPRPYFFRVLLEIQRVLVEGGRCFIHLLSIKQLREHFDQERFKREVNQQVHNLPGHWHHFYTAQEIAHVLAYGVGASGIDIKDTGGSIFLTFGKGQRLRFASKQSQHLLD